MRLIITMKIIAIFCGCILMILGIAYSCLAVVGLAPTPYTCMTETREVIGDLSGLDFLVTETSCDLLAKDDATSIFVSKTGVLSYDLIFKYEGPPYEYPDFDIDDNGAIRISVGYVDEVFHKRTEWNGVPIKYDLGGRASYKSEGSQSP